MVRPLSYVTLTLRKARSGGLFYVRCTPNPKPNSSPFRLGGPNSPGGVSNYAHGMSKPTRTAKQLQQMLVQRIEAQPGLRGQQTDVHRGGVIGIPSDDGGPNWTVRVVTDRGNHRGDIAQIIRTMQMQYDLED